MAVEIKIIVEDDEQAEDIMRVLSEAEVEGEIDFAFDIRKVELHTRRKP